MYRDCDINDISDGKFYDMNDMVRVGCNDCKGCSACCRSMGKSIELTPLDIFNMCLNLKCSFQQLLANNVELSVVDGLVLPNIKMSNEKDACSFLNDEGRCSIHAFRPGVCRLFPLGRYYENNDFKYFVQVDECMMKNKTKVKVKKWLNLDDYAHNKEFILNWHYFLKRIIGLINESEDDVFIRNMNMYVLNNFYVNEFDYEKDFYEQVNMRLMKCKNELGIG